MKTAGSLYDLYAPDKEQKILKPLGVSITPETSSTTAGLNTG
jgi:hypothetical protein